MPEAAEEFISYLISVGRLDEAATRLAGIINDDKFVSKAGKSKHQVILCIPSPSFVSAAHN